MVPDDLPLNFHPATTGVRWSFTPIGAGCAIAPRAELSSRAAGRVIAVVRCRANPAGVWYPRAEWGRSVL